MLLEVVPTEHEFKFPRTYFARESSSMQSSLRYMGEMFIVCGVWEVLGLNIMMVAKNYLAVSFYIFL